MKTVSLELAKALKEKGYSQEHGEFYWIWSFGKENHTLLSNTAFNKLHEEDYASPTADEILDVLPHQLLIKDVLYQLTIIKINGWTYGISYVAIHTNKTLQAEVEDTLTDAAAKMWLYLKENNLLGVK